VSLHPRLACFHDGHRGTEDVGAMRERTRWITGDYPVA